MKTLYIEAQRKQDICINSINFNSLPPKVFLAYSIQYKPLALNIKRKLEKKGKKITGFKQVLGCTEFKSKEPLLFIGSGRFHALNLALQGNRVFVLEEDKIKKFSTEETNKIKAKKKAAFSKFLAADKIGILVSLKPGQENINQARGLQKKLEKQGKSVFLFIADNIDIRELENYNIPVWINTACPALIFDFPENNFLNIKDIPLK